MGRQPITQDQFIKNALKVHGDRYDYSHVNYVNSRLKVEIVCAEHGSFWTTPAVHIKGSGCPKCARRWSEEHRKNHLQSSRKSRGFTTEEWVARAKTIHKDKYDYSLVEYVNQRTKVKIICPEHGLFEQKADSHLRGNGCPQCGVLNKAKWDHSWSDAQREKIAMTCLERYGATRYLDSEEGKQKLKEVKNAPEFKEKMHRIIASEEVQTKIRNTNLERYGVEFASQLPEVQARIFSTKKKNHTVSSSKGERIAYEKLVSRFGYDDVIHHYKCERYPFVADFYIVSLDLFIEFNLHWSHGKHWFGKDAKDKLVLEQWEQKAQTSRYYECAIKTWTVRDVKKRQIALENDLNYLAFWNSDLSDFEDWLNSDKCILKNI